MMSNVDRALHVLPDDVHRFIKASQSIPSFHSAVEEVVCNSLDAGSRCVDIFLDVDAFSFEIHDDGVGISYDDLLSVGQWNHTSKSHQCGDAYGMKGQALSALEELSYLSIVSTPPRCSCTYIRDHSQHISSLSKANSIHSGAVSGTVVKVLSLFYNLPVRRHSIRKDVELSFIREYVQHMSVLHHNVHWTLSLSSQGSLAGELTTHGSHSMVRMASRLLDLAGERSVVDRLTTIHGCAIVNKLQTASSTVGGFTVSGLLSPPQPGNCHWAKDCQYFFLNQRWMRGKDCVSTYLKQMYPKLVAAFAGVSGVGMVPRSNSSITANDRDRADRNRYPCFALQVTCGPTDYDVVLESDRTFAVFKDEQSLMRCIESMVLTMIEEHIPSEKRMDLVKIVGHASNIVHNGRINNMISSSSDTTSTSDTGDMVVCNLFNDYSCLSNNDDYATNLQENVFSVVASSSSPSAMIPLQDVPLSIAATSTGRDPSDDRLFSRAFFDSASDSTSMGSFKLRFSPSFSRSTMDDQSLSPPSSEPSTRTSRGSRSNRCFDDSPYSPHYRRSHPDDAAMRPMCLSRVKHCNDSLGDMITAEAGRNSMLQRKTIRRKRKLRHGDDPSTKPPMALVDGEHTAPIRPEYTVYVRRRPLMVDIALERSPGSCDEGTTASIDYDDRIYDQCSQQLRYDDDHQDDAEQCDDDDGADYESADNNNTYEYPYTLPTTSGADDPSQTANDGDDHSALYIQCDNVHSLPLAVDLCMDRDRNLSDDFKHRVLATDKAENFNRPPCLIADDTVVTSDREVKLNALSLRDRMEVVGQADRKYIITRSCNDCLHSDQSMDDHSRSSTNSCRPTATCDLCHNSSFLIALDQHAADERIRFERLLKLLSDTHRSEEASSSYASLQRDTIYGPDGVLRPIQVSIPLTLSSGEYAVAVSRKSLLNSWLYRYSIANKSSSELSGGRTAIMLEQVPEVLGVQLLQDDFRDFLSSISCSDALPDDLLQPPAMVRVLASKACRGAIMFGDLLDKTQRQRLVAELLQCDLPFNCAHGRPSMVPLVDLRPLFACKLKECQIARSNKRRRIIMR